MVENDIERDLGTFGIAVLAGFDQSLAGRASEEAFSVVLRQKSVGSNIRGRQNTIE